MTNLLSIRSHEFSRQAVERAPAPDEASTNDLTKTADSSPTFGETLAQATRSEAPDELAEAPVRPVPARDKKPADSDPQETAEDQPVERSIDARDAQAQKVPPITDGEPRKTDAAPLPTPVVAPIDTEPIETGNIESPVDDTGEQVTGETNRQTEDQAQGAPRDRTPERTEHQPDDQIQTRDARTVKPNGSDLPPPSQTPTPEPVKPLPQPAIQPAPIETSVILNADDRAAKPNEPRPPQQSTSAPAEQHAESGEPVKSEQSGKPSTPQSRSPLAPPLPSTSSPGAPTTAPLPAPATSPSPAPPITANSFLDLQPQAGARGSASGTHAASTPSSFSTQHAGEGPRADEFGPQMVRGALAMTRSTGGAMTIRLEPESLGALRIQMQISQGRVAVQFHAETAQARGLLNQHVETLRTAMESHGLKLDNVQIHTLARQGSTGSSGHEQQSHSQSGDDPNARHDAGGQQSRGHGDTAEREAQYRQAARQFRSPSQPGTSWRQQLDQAASSAATQTPALASP